MGEGSRIYDLQLEPAGACVRIRRNGLGLVITDTHAVNGDPGCRFLHDTSTVARTTLGTNTFLGNDTDAAILVPNGGDVSIERMHVENVHNVIHIGSANVGRFNETGTLVIGHLDVNGFIPPDATNPNPLKRYSSVISVENFDSTQVNAQILKYGALTTLTPQFWLKNSATTAASPGAGEIPYVGPGGTQGQASYNNLIHNQAGRTITTL